MKYLFLKDKRKRILYQAFEERRMFLKILVKNMQISSKLRTLAYKQLISLPKDSSITRIKNRCLITNRSKAVYRKFGLSRLMFRKYL
jgi:ribosomal protein S14